MSRHLSPTAQLLRGSRLFSLPQPLPKPQIDSQAPLGYRTSDSCTTPFPTHQAISAPESSIRRGDWGFKRALPVRDTGNEVKPFVRTVARLTANDTIEHITDYEIASDLEKTWDKFQEMKIAMVRTDVKKRIGGENKSAFEPLYDYTDRASAPTLGPNAEGTNARWKYSGPSIGDMTQRDFTDFVTKRLQRQKKDFDKLIRAEVLRVYLRNRRAEAQERLQNTKTVGRTPAGHVTEDGKNVLTPGPEGEVIPNVARDDADDPASLVNLSYMNWLCQLHIGPSSSSSVELDEPYGSWSHYMKGMERAEKRQMKNHLGSPIQGGREGFLSHLDSIATQHGGEKVKEILLQEMGKIENEAYEHMLSQPDSERIPNVNLPLPVLLKEVYFEQISAELSMAIPEQSYLSTMVEELNTLPRQESMDRIANVLVAEWEFLAMFKSRFETSYLNWLVSRRADITVTSELNKLIREFLDIPGLKADDVSGKSDKAAAEKFTTHPSGGLSYLKTNNYFDNHPILGPQSTRTTFDARLLSPRSHTSREGKAHLGIGGFVAQETGQPDPALASVNLVEDGGLKVPMEVSSASMNRWASVKLYAQKPRSSDTQNIKLGHLEHATTETYKKQQRAEPFQGRYNNPLDAAPSEQKRQGAAIANLIDLLKKTNNA
ncbi:hypothetical protein BLS_009245 [Venturia inaequalis]|uniref:Uncharacterized protein n=1 Tax=Venturia inaequalis TaxID=5025 RepID=A0A8H3UA68_VENIN|nr:hypothetical protein BLS_009245 [Venturia inaequalis]KAE9965643.1 hypothetical protein EG328_009497 [Venturia inaequalis]KAE9970114.1 hypothetical protein EG327_010373 [Venturia inaequalis]RDI87031.1 hypothetical protein Vi05172_g3281 [Venturia inaequalis]